MLREKLEDTVLVRVADAALGNQSGDKASGRDIKPVVCSRALLRRNAHFHLPPLKPSVGVLYFFRAALFDRDFLNPSRIFQSKEDDGSAT